MRRMKMKKQSLLFSLILCALLSACGNKDEASGDLLSYYTFEGDTIPSIEQFLTDETGGRLVATLSPTSSEDQNTSAQNEGSDEDTAEGTQEETDASSGETVQNYLSYDYQQFTEGQSASVAKSYVELLQGDDIALHTESEDEPSFSSNAGSVTLIRQAVATDSSGAPQKKETASSSGESDTETEDEQSDETDEANDTTLLPLSLIHI